MLYHGSTLFWRTCGQMFNCAHTSGRVGAGGGCCQHSSNQWNLTGIYELCNACPIRWSACKRNPRCAHTVSDSCLLWVSFDIISAQWTAPAICHCAWPLGSCKGETCGGRPIMGQQHLPCDVSGQKRLKPSAYEQLTYLSIKQIKNKTTTCRSTNFQYCKCDLALLRHQANMEGFVYLAFSCAATPVAPPWGYSKCVRPEEAPTFRCLPDYFAWDITWSYCVFEWYPNECESGWNSRHSRASSNKWHCYNHGQVAVA